MFHYGKSGDTNFFARLSLTSPDALPLNPPLHLAPREESKAWQIEINERGRRDVEEEEAFLHMAMQGG